MSQLRPLIEHFIYTFSDLSFRNNPINVTTNPPVTIKNSLSPRSIPPYSCIQKPKIIIAMPSNIILVERIIYSPLFLIELTKWPVCLILPPISKSINYYHLPFPQYDQQYLQHNVDMDNLLEKNHIHQ